MELLKFFTCGNVDDGKSTLIGRLLYDSGSVSADILQTLGRQSQAKGEDTGIDLALLTDGLRAEREQGITIDVAYKYFTTPRRKFIIVDTPGHIQYTRNMVTGASNCDLAIILIDARHGITEQTRRHSILASLLGIPHLVVCVNKMDLADWREDRYREILKEYQAFSQPLAFHEVTFIPVSALAGDNVVTQSGNMPWYTGPSLLEHLEAVDPGSREFDEPRFQVQYIIRPQTKDLHDYRGLAGKVLSGTYRVGDRIKVLPSGLESRIVRLESNLKDLQEVSAPLPAVIHLEQDLDVSRGATLAVVGTEPRVSQEFEAALCWMDEKPLVPGSKFLLQHQTQRVRAVVKEVLDLIDIHTFERKAPPDHLGLNTLCRVRIKTAEPLAWDPYTKSRETGGFVLIHETSHGTVAAGMMEDDDLGEGI